MTISERAYQKLLANNPQLGVIRDDGPAPAYRLTPAPHAAPTEHEEQCALFAWAAANEGVHPELANMFAVPNGGYRPMVTAQRLAEEGVKAGVPDALLMCRRGPYGGLAIELKRADRSNHATPEQRAWLDRLRAAGYMAVVCYGAEEAIGVIATYLQLEVQP